VTFVSLRVGGCAVYGVEKLVQAFFTKKLSTEQIAITLYIYQTILAIFSHLKGSFLKKKGVST
ncbi:hypothetical protein, partial [Vibrio parahaemolyticus]|uniref:hypothetical protein n=1 Tax=Vibrio parahaemolyticus TaxID=670 RepID=UPI001F159D4B